MSSHGFRGSRFRALFAAVLVLVSAGQAVAAVCPASMDGQRLARMNIFDGDPARGADLAPATRGTPARYHNAWDFPGGSRGVVLVCTYGSGATATIALPDGTGSCSFDGRDGAGRASCR